ncbi:hypothetical protein CY34DRAFT_11887 [Suillus luteus UH-Slu-Lm8-n1]|uniref:Uncharacterized protein n=1 Tax=Suillus luteus UH-Slu-Lm8-n1 TaxID=930992 RepID=A0A0D0BA52_9AGAM|nr:hypothetical protein CY34DRAFT_11887 [Suillus luteus UH-Slu-Lm8-n1]
MNEPEAPEQIPLPLETIRQGYNELGHHTHVVLRTQLGDSARLNAAKREYLRFIGIVEQHANILSQNELLTIQTSIYEMLNALDDAVHLSADPPDHDPPQLSYTAHTGRRGRPQVDIEPELLEIALSMRGLTHLASVFGCAPRTIRRRALEYGLAELGPPVYVDYTDDEGNTTHFFTAAIGDPSGLTDDELDAITRQILETFPAFGCWMIGGHMKHLGHDVPRRCIQESYT